MDQKNKMPLTVESIRDIIKKVSRKSAYLGGSFFILFLAYGTIQSYMTSLYGALGYYYYAAIYIPYMISSFMTLIVNQKIGIKVSLIIGLLTYSLWLLSVCIDNWKLILGISVLNGFGAGMLWINQGVYLTIIVNNLNHTIGLNTNNGKNWNGYIIGIFNMLYGLKQVIGNIIVIVMIQLNVSFPYIAWSMFGLSLVALLLMILLPNPESLSTWSIIWNKLHLYNNSENNSELDMELSTTELSSTGLSSTGLSSTGLCTPSLPPTPLPSLPPTPLHSPLPDKKYHRNHRHNRTDHRNKHRIHNRINGRRNEYKRRIFGLSPRSIDLYELSNSEISSTDSSTEDNSSTEYNLTTKYNSNNESPKIMLSSVLSSRSSMIQPIVMEPLNTQLSDKYHEYMNKSSNSAITLSIYFSNMYNCLKLPYMMLLFPRYILSSFLIIFSNGVLPRLFSSLQSTENQIVLYSSYYLLVYGVFNTIWPLVWGKLYDKLGWRELTLPYMTFVICQYVSLMIFQYVGSIHFSEFYYLANAVLSGMIDTYNVSLIYIFINRYEKKYSGYLFTWYMIVYCLFAAVASLISTIADIYTLSGLILGISILTELSTKIYLDKN